MNTLGKTITQSFYTTESGFHDIETAWKAAIATGFKPTTHDLLSYAILRGKDWTKGFSAITNSTKLANGRQAFDTGHSSLNYLLRRGPSTFFTDFLVKDICEILNNLLPPIRVWISGELIAYKEIVNV